MYLKMYSKDGIGCLVFSWVSVMKNKEHSDEYVILSYYKHIHERST